MSICRAGACPRRWTWRQVWCVRADDNPLSLRLRRILGRVAVGASCCAPWRGACILRPRPCREAATTGAISEGRTSVVNRRKGDYDAGKDRSPYHIRRRRRSILPPLKGSVWTTVPLEGKPLRSRVKPPLLGEVAAEGRRKGFAHSGYPEPYGQRKRRTAGSRPRPTTPKNTLSSHKTARQSSLPPGRIHAAPTFCRNVKNKPYRSHRGSVPEGAVRPESRTPQGASRPAPLGGEPFGLLPPEKPPLPGEVAAEGRRRGETSPQPEPLRATKNKRRGQDPALQHRERGSRPGRPQTHTTPSTF